MSGIKQAVAQAFGAAAQAYRTSSVHASGADLARLVELARLEGSERVLDAGCGAGHTAVAFATHVRTVLAVDLSSEMLAVTASLAAERGIANLEVRRGDVEWLPAADGEFDLVVSRYSAHHWPHPEHALSEIARVLRPGGRFLLGDIVSWDDPTSDSYLQAIEVLRDPSHVRDHSAAQWLEMLAAAGFAAETAWRFPVPIEFTSWVERIRTPEAHLPALRSLLAAAPLEVRAALAVDEAQNFVIQGAIFVATLA